MDELMDFYMNQPMQQQPPTDPNILFNPLSMANQSSKYMDTQTYEDNLRAQQQALTNDEAATMREFMPRPSQDVIVDGPPPPSPMATGNAMRDAYNQMPLKPGPDFPMMQYDYPRDLPPALSESDKDLEDFYMGRTRV